MFPEVFEFLWSSLSAARFDAVWTIADNVCGDGLQQGVVPVIQRHRSWQHWQELIECLHGAFLPSSIRYWVVLGQGGVAIMPTLTLFIGKVEKVAMSN